MEITVNNVFLFNLLQQHVMVEVIVVRVSAVRMRVIVIVTAIAFLVWYANSMVGGALIGAKQVLVSTVMLRCKM